MEWPSGTDHAFRAFWNHPIPSILLQYAALNSTMKFFSLKIVDSFGKVNQILGPNLANHQTLIVILKYFLYIVFSSGKIKTVLLSKGKGMWWIDFNICSVLERTLMWSAQGRVHKAGILACLQPVKMVASFQSELRSKGWQGSRWTLPCSAVRKKVMNSLSQSLTAGERENSLPPLSSFITCFSTNSITLGKPVQSQCGFLCAAPPHRHTDTGKDRITPTSYIHIELSGGRGPGWFSTSPHHPVPTHLAKQKGIFCQLCLKLFGYFSAHI